MGIRLAMNDDFWEVVCPWAPLFGKLFIINTGLFVFLLAIFPFVDRNSGTFTVSLITFAVLGVSMVGSGIVVRFCSKHE